MSRSPTRRSSSPSRTRRSRPSRQGLPGVPQDLRHVRGGHPLPRQARPAPAEADGEDHPELQEGVRGGHQRVLRQEQEALRPAGAPRSARRLHEDRAQANQAKAALEDGDSFKQVAKQYWIDEASKAQGGKLPAVTEGQQEQAFDQAIFGAKKGELVGPVKTQFGWYVFEVNKVTPASQQTLEESKESIRNLLARRPADCPRQVDQELPRGLQGQDGLRGRLPDRVQQRAEGEDEHRLGLRRHPGRQPADAPAVVDAPPGRLLEAIRELDEITRRLRRECPWDREQDERSIVPHTVEEAYGAGGRRPLGRRRQAARRAWRRPLPGSLPVRFSGSAGRGRSPRWPTTAARSRFAAIRTCSATSPPCPPARSFATGTRSSARTSAAARSSATSRDASSTLAKKILKRAQSAGRRREGTPGDTAERLLAAVQEAVEEGEDRSSP